MNEPGKALKARRELAGLSQQDLAVSVEMHAASIGQIERGIQSPPRGTVAALDKALGAGGQLLAEFGYVSDEMVNRLDGLDAALAELRRQLEAFQSTRKDAVDAMLDRFQAMERRVDHIEWLAERRHAEVEADSGESS